MYIYIYRERERYTYRERERDLERERDIERESGIHTLRALGGPVQGLRGDYVKAVEDESLIN